MLHTIRRYGQLEQIDCEFGSGVRDKNGVEIFEGDRIRADGLTGEVVFTNGEFFFAFDNLDGYGGELNEIPSNELEIVGHVDD